MKIMIRHAGVMIYSLLALASTFSVADSIHPSEAPDRFGATEQTIQSEQTATAPWFEFSPFSANNRTVVPGFADPLGTGVDPGLRIFDGRVLFMDLLGYFQTEEPDDTEVLEMPYGTLRADDFLGSLLSIHLARERAFDQSLLKIQDAEITERDGLPVTTETSPLSLAGFGNVTENQKPFFLHWTVCPAQEKRRASMEEAMDKKKRACTAPGVCICSSI
jgi:hypothetical protein